MQTYLPKWDLQVSTIGSNVVADGTKIEPPPFFFSKKAGAYTS